MKSAGGSVSRRSFRAATGAIRTGQRDRARKVARSAGSSGAAAWKERR